MWPAGEGVGISKNEGVILNYGNICSHGEDVDLSTRLKAELENSTEIWLDI